MHVADDGVARSYDEENTVIDFVGLTNAQLMQIIAQLPNALKNETEHLHTVFDAVNGSAVVDEGQLRNPPSWLRPAKMSEVGQRSEPSQSRSFARNVESTLDARDYYCVGQPCTTSAACRFLGCSVCLSVDSIGGTFAVGFCR